MNQSQINTGKALINLVSENRILIEILEDTELSLQDMVAINKIKFDIIGNMPYTVLFVAPNFASISREAREFSASQKAYHNAMAKAIIVNNIAGSIIGNFFINVNKPPAPTKIFTNISDAKKWLDQF